MCNRVYFPLGVLLIQTEHHTSVKKSSQLQTTRAPEDVGDENFMAQLECNLALVVSPVHTRPGPLREAPAAPTGHIHTKIGPFPLARSRGDAYVNILPPGAISQY